VRVTNLAKNWLQLILEPNRNNYEPLRRGGEMLLACRGMPGATWHSTEFGAMAILESFSIFAVNRFHSAALVGLLIAPPSV
jgi:hypothetical protein